MFIAVSSSSDFSCIIPQKSLQGYVSFSMSVHPLGQIMQLGISLLMKRSCMHLRKLLNEEASAVIKIMLQLKISNFLQPNETIIMEQDVRNW